MLRRSYCLARQARSARIAPWSAPTSSAVADDKACLLPSPQHGAWRNPVLDCSAHSRSLRADGAFGTRGLGCSVAARGVDRQMCAVL
jgi:hypothetical protein